MKTLCIVIALSLLAVGCGEKAQNAGGWYEGPGPDGVGKYKGPAQMVPNRTTYTTNDRELDIVQEAARSNGENAAALRNFNENWQAADR